MKTQTCIIAILLAGGLSNSHAQDTWTQKADFGGTARNKAAGFSFSSKGYIGTGDDGVLKKDFWEYDPTTNAWIQKANFGGTGRANAAGFSIGSTGYIGDGYNGTYINEFWAYDSATNVWTQKASVGTPRQYEVGFSIGSKGYIGTGYDGIAPYTRDFWEYDPDTNTWTQKADFGGTGRALAVGFSIGSKGYIGTGNDPTVVKKDFWEYDPTSNTWTQKADFGGTARNWAVGFPIGNKGYIGTGYDLSGVTKDFWEYDPVTDTWTQKADFGGTARGRAVGFSIGSKGYIGTGADSADVLLKDFWEYTPETAQTPGTWTATGSMSIGRTRFTATLLTNGKVLVAGGSDNSGNVFASAELYDPSTGIWTATGSMTGPWQARTATLLQDGRVLVAGGQNLDATSGAEVYDPDSGTWTATGSMNTPRSGHIATLITGGPLAGMVLVTGGGIHNIGGDQNLKTAELYDPSTGIWSYTGSMSIARYWDDQSPAALPDGSVLVVGGTTCCPYNWFNKAETYDSVTQMWTPTSTKMTNANEATILLPDGKVLVAGGVKGTQPTSVNVADAELFDSSTGTWTATASMSTDRNEHTLTLLTSGQALVAGGTSGGWGVCNDLTSAELYDSSAGTWFPTGTMTAARFFHTATLLPNGQVLAAGGQDCEGNVLSSAELYTPPSAAVVSLSQTALTFKTQLVGTTSKPQSVTLTNAGGATLTISSIAASGDFLAKNNCGSSVPAGASCTINVAFNPSAKGARTGSVTITDDAADSPQTIKLTGIGTIVQLAPSALNFGNQIVGTTSDPQTATITNIGSEDLHISEIGLGGANFGDFTATTTCGSKLVAGGSCAIDVTFTPTVKGHRHAKLLITDDGGGSPQSVPLTGTGVLHWGSVAAQRRPWVWNK